MAPPPPPKALTAPQVEQGQAVATGPQIAQLVPQVSQERAFVPYVYTPPSPIANLATAVSSVMKEIGVVGKEGVNKFHNYKYATIGDVLHKLTPLLGKHGLMIVQDEVKHNFDQRHVAVTYEFSIAHSSGEVWPHKPRKTGMAIAVDSKGNWDDKSFNKAATAARKYFLLELFQVPTGDMEEADNDTAGAGAATPPAPSRQAPPPPPPPPQPVDDSKPHRIVLGKGTGAVAWAEAFIKAIGAATTAAELADWIDANQGVLSNLETSHPDIFKRVDTAIGVKQGDFEGSPVEDSVPPPRGEDIPDPIEDPDAAINFIAQRLNEMKIQEELELWWNVNVAPIEDKWFPPDFELLLKEFKRQETRIAAEEAK